MIDPSTAQHWDFFEQGEFKIHFSKDRHEDYGWMYEFITQHDTYEEYYSDTIRPKDWDDPLLRRRFIDRLIRISINLIKKSGYKKKHQGPTLNDTPIRWVTTDARAFNGSKLYIFGYDLHEENN